MTQPSTGPERLERSLRVLHLEDDTQDAEIIAWKLRSDGLTCEIVHVADKDGYARALNSGGFDLILCDYNLRDYDGISAVALARSTQSEAPVIVISGTLSEDEAVDCLRGGATDYVFKQRLQRLAPAALRALREVESQRNRQMTEAALRLRELAMDVANNAIFIVDTTAVDQPIVYVNRAFAQMTGFAAAEVLGRSYSSLAATDENQPELQRLQEVIRAGGEAQVVLRDYNRDGVPAWHTVQISPLRSTDGVVTHVVGIQTDITEIKNYQLELEYRANYDGLTGLANKNLLSDRLNQGIARAKRAQKGCALLFFDLDRFKLVNDSLGHAKGDALLQQVAARLRSHVRTSDTVARLGGDEFAIVLGDTEDTGSVAAVAHKVLDDLTRPIPVDGHELFAPASVGVCVYPRDGSDPDTLLKNADTAMYRAKRNGGNQICFYTEDLNANAVERLHLEAALRRALAASEFVLYYQPRIVLGSGETHSVEALLRWRHDGTLLLPDRFIPIAEETGLIIPIGEWVLRTACAQIRRWSPPDKPGVRIAVNLSPAQFRSPDLLGTVKAILKETGADPHCLEFEITESTAMHDPELSRTLLQSLSDLGIALAIDDFGTGYSSLAYLKRFPIRDLKIDRSFVQGIPDDENDMHIVRSIIALGRSLGLTVIAEGVETEQQRTFLEDAGCDEVQGFLFSRPKPCEELEDVLPL